MGTEKPYKVDYEKLTKTKVTLPIITIIGFVVVGMNINGWSVDYFDDFFITKVAAEEQYKELSEQLTANTKVITSHILSYELNENARDTRRVQEKLGDLDLYVAANGTNPIVTARRAELQAELGRLGRARACILRKDPDEDCTAVI